jgi:acetate kinase
MKILSINVGSTSLKFKLFEINETQDQLLAWGRITDIAQPASKCILALQDKDQITETITVSDYTEAIARMIRFLSDKASSVLPSIDELAAVGFKTVHARDVTEAVELTDEILARMEEYNTVAPAHNPPYIDAIRKCKKVLPGKPMIGLFEPTFHQTIPEHAYLYGVPFSWYQKYGIRRYGFHGASHRYVAERVPQILGLLPKGLKIISCHLGGSSSITAIQNGKSIDNSMGFSPQSGVIHSTRSGDLDPFVLLYLMKKEGWSVDEAVSKLCEQSGLLGLSGITGDCKTLEQAAGEGDERAIRAVRVFIHGIQHYIGAYLVALGGLDAIVFTGGIGEQSPFIRAEVCKPLHFLGIHLDPVKNANAAGEAEIHASESQVKILVVPTDEELIVARATAELLKKRNITNAQRSDS